MYISQNYYFVFRQLHQIVQLYQELDQITCDVSNLFSVKCPDGCGECCNTASKNIEVTITQMLPLCVYLFQENTYQLWLDKAPKDNCLFYETKSNHNNGCCALYEYRPLVCRLFGYSFIKNKYGAIVPVACSTLKKQYNAKNELTAINTDCFPLINAFSLQLMTIDPLLSSKRYAINDAFAEAMEYVILTIEFASCDTSCKDKIA